MLKHGRATTSVMLLAGLVFQTACVRSMGPPAPLRPHDANQREAIEDASLVQVNTAGGAEYWLKDVSMGEQCLMGEQRKGGAALELPIDSIEGIQLYEKSNYRWLFGVVPLTAAVWFIILAGLNDPFPPTI